MSDPPIDYLSVEDLLEIAVGVIGDVAIRDHGLLASAAGRPQSRAFGNYAYPTFAGKAAALIHSLARNHALADGNQRLAWAATRAFCLLNGRDLEFTVDQAEQFVLAVARGELDVPDITTLLDVHLSQLRRCRRGSARSPEHRAWGVPRTGTTRRDRPRQRPLILSIATVRARSSGSSSPSEISMP